MVQPAVFACGTACLLLQSCLGTILFIFAALERNRLDPLYAPIRCKSEAGNTPISQEFVDLGPGNHSDEVKAAALLQTNLTMDKWNRLTCDNPNQLAITSFSVGEGTVNWRRIEAGEEILTQIGKFWTAPFTLPMQGTEVYSRNASFSADLQTAAMMAATPPSLLVYYSKMRSETELTIFGVPIKTARDWEVVCLQNVNYATQETGVIKCGHGYDEMPELEREVLPYDTPDPDGGIRWIESEKANKEGSKMRDMLCGALMALGLLLALGCSSCAACLYVRQRPRASSEMDIEAPGERLSKKDDGKPAEQGNGAPKDDNHCSGEGIVYDVDENPCSI